MSLSTQQSIANVKAVKARIWLNKEPKEIEIKSRTVARTICALVMAKDKGVTALEMSGWAFRLGAYIHILKRDNGLDIEMKREDHEGGWHGRYFLHTPIEILEAR